MAQPRLMLLFFLLFSFSIQQALNQTPSDSCSNQNTCHECIQSKGCVWCSKPSLDQSSNDGARCFSSRQISTGNYECESRFLVDPKNEVNVLVEKPLTKVGGPKLRAGPLGDSHGEEIVQITPQKIGLKLRLNEPQRITFSYSRAEDYPVDLYYLMDLSKSMEDDKNKLSNLGDLLAETMKNITKDFRLGFGSFVDKPLMPFASTLPEKLESPCSGCAAPYGFKNHMRLDTNTKLFSQEVNRSQISGNIDTPEGGFDALMQVIVCDEEIGWRSQARRLVVFSTDAGFHYAGDGKLAGVIKPNDCKCHVQNHAYTHSTLQDYPSVAQINKVAKQNAINLIFAVTKDQEFIYGNLSSQIEGSSYSKLEDDSSNIVDLIREGYNKISSAVEIKDDSNNFLTLKYFSKCLRGSSLTETNKCNDLKVGVPVEFQLEVVANTCPEYPGQKRQTVKIYPVGIDEALVLDIEFICNCNCETPSDPNYESHSPKCNSHGTHKCGICDCDDGFYGRKCECSQLSTSFEGTSPTTTCRPDNTTLVDCNNRGNCICGVCGCHARPNPDERITGKYCECDNFSCERHEGQVCAGPNHGSCRCGVCECLPGWSGPACACQVSTDSCRVAGESELCSGHGECVCGECKCETTDETRYSGKYCDRCPTCPGRCQEFEDCVQCKMYQTGPLAKDGLCETSCTHISIEGTDKVELSNDIYDHVCTLYDENNCRFQFVYNDRDENLVVIRAQHETDCPPTIFTLGVILWIIGTILLIGLATLLFWKLLTTIKDRREYARFLEESKNAKFNAGQNPLYKEATTTVANPMYTDG